MKLDALKKIYKYDDVDKTFIVEISLDYYQELFNAWDAAPIRKKDLDPELVRYLEDVGEDIPLKEKIAIVFIMPSSVLNRKTEQISKQVFTNYFTYLIHYDKREMKKIIKQSIFYLLTGFIFILLAYLIPSKDTLISEVLSEGMFIGGWVFIWEAISAIFFKFTSIRNNVKRSERFRDAEIRYIYRTKDTHKY